MLNKEQPGLCHYATRHMLEQTFAPVPPTPRDLEWKAYDEQRHAILGGNEPWSVKAKMVQELRYPGQVEPKVKEAETIRDC